MSRPLASLGSLAALAGALATAQQASAQLMLSDISNEQLGDYNGSSFAIDINGDAVVDFNLAVFGGSFAGATLSNYDGNSAIVLNSGSSILSLQSLGGVVDGSADYFNSSTFDSFASAGTSYVGVSFFIQGSEHYGWLEFSFPTTDFRQGTLVGAAWQATPGMSATISQLSAVPEPATVGLIGGLCAGLAAFWRRRQRPRTAG